MNEDAPPEMGDLLESPPSPPLPSPAPEVSAEPPAQALSMAATKTFSSLMRLLAYCGLFFGIGGLLFGIFVKPGLQRLRQISQDLIFMGLAALPVSVSLRGLEILGRPLNDAIHPEVWRAGLSSSWGATALMAAAAFALGLIALGARLGRRLLALAAGLAGGTALALGGSIFEASLESASPQWLLRPASVLYAGSVIFWVGALAPLAFLLLNGTARTRGALSRFSVWLPYAVGALALSGFVLAAARLGPFGEAWRTPAGAALLLQCALLAGAFLLALWGRLRLTSPALAGSLPARRRLSALIGVAAALVLGVLVLTTGLVFASPAALSAPTVGFAEI